MGQDNINPQAKKQIEEAFERLRQTIDGPDIKPLFDADIGLTYELTQNRLYVMTGSEPLISMEAWVMAALAFLLDYTYREFPDPESFMRATQGLVLLYKKIWHPVSRMVWLLKQEGKTIEQIADFMAQKLPSLWRDTMLSDSQVETLIAQSLAMEGGPN